METLAFRVGFAHVLTALGLAVVLVIGAVIDLGGIISPNFTSASAGRLRHRCSGWRFRRGGCSSGYACSGLSGGSGG